MQVLRYRRYSAVSGRGRRGLYQCKFRGCVLMKTKKVAPEKLAREVLSTGLEHKQRKHLGGLTKMGIELIDHMATLSFHDYFC